MPESLSNFAAAVVGGVRPVADAVRLLRDLKRVRNFVAMSWLSEQILRVQDDPITIHLHAQALVELGYLSAAEEFLAAWTQKAASAPLSVRIDLAALKGRIAKQRAVEGRSRSRSDWGKHLDDALRAYSAAAGIAAGDPSLAHFPQINVLSLHRMAERLHVEYGTHVDRLTLEAAIVANLQLVPVADSWGLMSRIELALARGDITTFDAGLQCAMSRKKTGEARADYDKFLERIVEYVDILPDFDPYEIDLFAFGSLHRQLTEICGVDDTTVSDSIAASVAKLRAHILSRSGGSISLDPRIVGQSPLSSSRFERVFGREAPIELKWLGQGFLRAQCVASVGTLGGSVYGRLGTGFLLRILDASGQPIPNLILTNAHVACKSYIRERREIFAKDLRTDLRVRFEAASLEQQYRVVEAVWISLPEQHDAALLRIEDVGQFAPLQGTANEIEAGTSSNVFIIGHPRGSVLHISLSDNEVLATEYRRQRASGASMPVRLHYRCPTDPGSSGSPVFDSNWNVVALHRSGYSGRSAPPIDETVPPYAEANEGVTLASISAALVAETNGKYRIDLGLTR